MPICILSVGLDKYKRNLVIVSYTTLMGARSPRNWVKLFFTILEEWMTGHPGVGNQNLNNELG